MKITRQQREMLLSLSTTIKVKWDIRIGYSTPARTFTTEEDDYVILEEGDASLQDDVTKFLDDATWTAHLLHRQDVNKESYGVICQEQPVEFPTGSEEDISTFLDRVNKALESGEICFNPGITRFFDYNGEKLEIRCELYADSTFDIKVIDGNSINGKRRSLKELCEQVEKNLSPEYLERIQKANSELEPHVIAYIIKDDFIDSLILKVASELNSREAPVK